MKEWLETDGKVVEEKKLNMGKEIDARAAVGEDDGCHVHGTMKTE